MKISNSKIVITPNAIHITQFEKPYSYDYQRRKRITKPQRKSENTKQSSPNLKSAWRARKQVRLLIEANTDQRYFTTEGNFRPLFVTLTFADNIQQIKKANRLFSLFIKRLNYETTNWANRNGLVGYLQKQTYIVVPEFQKRGAVHFHVIFFKFPKVQDTNIFISQIWKHGFTFNNTIKSVSHLKNYVTKYFVKSLLDPRLRGKKHYFTSKNLLRPKILRDLQNNQNIIDSLQTNPTFQHLKNSQNGQTNYEIHEDHPLISILYN